MSLNKGTAAMLVSLINPPGIELFSYADVFFCFWSQNCIFDTEKKIVLHPLHALHVHFSFLDIS